MEKWKVAAYVRLSSDDGDKAESNSITNQKSLINLFLKNNKDLKLKDFYVDDGFTGTDFNRPDFQRLLNDMKNGKINAVLVKDLSRLGRNYIEVGNYLEQIFPLYSIRFIAINDNVDSFKDPGSVNSVMVPFKNLMNDEYARDISNKVRSVLNTKKENGEFIGSVAPYGYLRDPNNGHKFIIDKTASKVVKKIFKMALSGKSKIEIIDELNKFNILPPRLYSMQGKKYKFEITDEMKRWNRKKLDKILTNRCYTGELIQNKKRTISHKIHKAIDTNEDEWIIVPNHHEAIITKEDFDKVQDIICERDIRTNKQNEYDLFSGYLVCADCGNTFSIRKAKGYEYYYCTSFIRNKTCSKHTIRKSKLIETVLEILNKQIDLVFELDEKINQILESDNINYDIEILNSRIDIIDNNIEKFKKLKEELKNDLLCEYINRDEYIEYEKEYENQLKEYHKNKKIISNKLKKINFKSDDSRNWIDKFKSKGHLERLDRKTVDELIDDIVIYDNGNIVIKFKYQDEYFEAINFLNQHSCDIIKQENYLVQNECFLMA